MVSLSSSATLIAVLPRQPACKATVPLPARLRALVVGTESDEILLAAVTNGDERALRALVSRHEVTVYRFVLRHVGNRATAEEIVSDVFVELWRQASRFEGRARLATWLLAIARHKALSVMRRRADAPLEDGVAEAVADCAPTAEEMLVDKSRSVVLRDALTRLSARHREVIDLVYYHDKSVEEVAAITGAPVATVKTRLFHARRWLRELVARMERPASAA
jgi:RNA polymerase sigma-70 factor, ECF subfamily